MAKMTEKQDIAYDTKHQIKEGSARDVKVDAKHGLPPEHAKKAPTMTGKNGVAPTEKVGQSPELTGGHAK